MKKLISFLFPFLIALMAFGPSTSLTVTGKVKDDKGNPVIAASVVEKGTSNAVVTDSTGNFSIEVANENAVLVISSIGFDITTVKVKGKNFLSVILNTANNVMQEVLVTGLSGKVAGVAVTNSAIRIRGARSINSYAQDKQTYYPYSMPKSESKRADNNNYYGKRLDSVTDDFNTEDYDNIVENPFLKTNDNPLSTFSIDVDAASYSNVRRYLKTNQLPPAGAVRIEEMINYFKYDYSGPEGDKPFAVHTEISFCPWNSDNRLVLVGLQGKKVPLEDLPPSNLVFLIDVSGSMMDENKLPLVKYSMKLLADQLREQDRVSIVVYAGNAGLVLSAASGAEKEEIKEAIDKLEAGGSTAGGAGIKLAYKIAKENFMKEGNNRVILCTDGDFNIGVSSDDDLVRLVENERKSGVFLTVLGYGMGNYKDNKMQKLADKGNGNHAYIDEASEAKKVLVNEFGGTLFTIAKDVKLQVEFNPAKVQGYRLIGYENRMLAKENFNDDKKDAGELGSGHTVTALYEIIPAGVKSSFLKDVDALRYQQNKQNFTPVSNSDEIMNIKLRYKDHDGDVSKLIDHPVLDKGIIIDKTSDNFRFAAAVAEFGLLLRNSAFKSSASYAQVITLAKKAKGEDKEGYRKEFLKLVSNAHSLVAKIEIEDDGVDDGGTIANKQ